MTVLILLGYLMVGIGLARIAFIYMLGDAQRYTQRKKGRRLWTYAMIRAFWTAVGMLLAWPVTGLFCLIFAPTPHEKSAESLARARRDVELTEKLAKEHDLPGINATTNQ